MLFSQGKLSSAEEIKTFSKEFLVAEVLVMAYIKHLEDLKLKAEKRQAESKNSNKHI